MQNRAFLSLVLTPLFILLAPHQSFASKAQCESIFDKISLRGVVHPWLASESNLAFTKILENISAPGTKPGAVVAAQTKSHPNYWYHWVRDGALTVESLVQTYKRSTDRDQKLAINQKISQYMNFSEGNQTTYTLTGEGEPKFNVDGSAFNDPWGRPQNDGPAIRATSLIHWLNTIRAEGISDSVLRRFYDSKIPTDSLIKRDLEYISHHWSEPCFDIWEEVKGDHFYTRFLQRRALIEGATLARSLGDSGAADWYTLQAKAIEDSILSFWDADKGIFVVTKNRVEGLDYKTSGVDSQVLLAFIHGGLDDGFLPLTDPRVQSTIDNTIAAFKDLYPINQRPEIPGVGIGRYPEDKYGGDNFNQGNPWVLSTLAVAEIYYKKATEAAGAGQQVEASGFRLIADQYVSRVQYHAQADGSLNEQMNRDTGFMQSVRDLTWNYAAVLTTYYASIDATTVSFIRGNSHRASMKCGQPGQTCKK